MSDPNTSAIFTAWRTVTRLLREATFAPSPLAAGPVAVWFGDYDLPPGDEPLSNERVVVAPFARSPDQEWGPIGRLSRDERFEVFVYVITAIPGQTSEQAAMRLEELTCQVELLIRTINEARTLGATPAEFTPYPVWWIAPQQVNPVVAPDNNGAIGKAEIALRCSFRIGTPPVE